MSKLSNEGGFLNKRSLSKQQNLNIVDKNVKKCSIIPALKPTYRPKNSHSSSKSNPFYVQSD